MSSEFILGIGPERREGMLEKVGRFLTHLDAKKAWRLTVEPYKPRRSSRQNAFLWLTYQRILDEGGEELRGWDREDLHEFFLISCYGSEIIEGFGVKRHKPLKRSSKLSTTEFMDFVDFIQRFCAERGIYVPDPNEEQEAM